VADRVGIAGAECGVESAQVLEVELPDVAEAPGAPERVRDQGREVCEEVPMFRGEIAALRETEGKEAQRMVIGRHEGGGEELSVSEQRPEGGGQVSGAKRRW
jgi:hypothetical protein